MKLLLIAVTLFFTACSTAQDKGAEYFQKDGAAIGGYDPVAFFTESKPVKGSAAYQLKWKDADWQFASQQNLDSFKVAPEKYAPQYGGYCAFGASRGYKAPTEADTWTVHNGKMYFNYNQEVKNTWDKDRPTYIAKADGHWEKIRLGK